METSPILLCAEARISVGGTSAIIECLVKGIAKGVSTDTINTDHCTGEGDHTECIDRGNGAATDPCKREDGLFPIWHRLLPVDRDDTITVAIAATTGVRASALLSSCSMGNTAKGEDE